MYAAERQHRIAERLHAEGRISVAELAAEHLVTTETVRRDLSVLEKAGLLRRVHGGAVPTAAVLEARLSERNTANAAEKDRIAKFALSLIPPQQASLLLDAGSTVGRLAAQLTRHTGLTVFTHALPIAASLAAAEAVQLNLLPGRVRGTTEAAVGVETVAALARLHADVVFLGTNGISLEHGLTTPNVDEAAAKRALVGAAARVVLLADATKFGPTFTVTFAEVAQLDTVVTDSRIAPQVVAALEERGVEVCVT